MTLVIGDLPPDKYTEITSCLDNLDICPCRECNVFFDLDDLVIPEGEDGHAEEGFTCRPCLEASGKKEFWF
jgi:hypothetical protein